MFAKKGRGKMIPTLESKKRSKTSEWFKWYFGMNMRVKTRGWWSRWGWNLKRNSEFGFLESLYNRLLVLSQANSDVVSLKVQLQTQKDLVESYRVQLDKLKASQVDRSEVQQLKKELEGKPDAWAWINMLLRQIHIFCQKWVQMLAFH